MSLFLSSLEKVETSDCQDPFHKGLFQLVDNNQQSTFLGAAGRQLGSREECRLRQNGDKDRSHQSGFYLLKMAPWAASEFLCTVFQRRFLPPFPFAPFRWRKHLLLYSGFCFPCQMSKNEALWNIIQKLLFKQFILCKNILLSNSRGATFRKMERKRGTLFNNKTDSTCQHFVH